MIYKIYQWTRCSSLILAKISVSAQDSPVSWSAVQEFIALLLCISALLLMSFQKALGGLKTPYENYGDRVPEFPALSMFVLRIAKRSDQSQAWSLLRYLR